MIFDIESFGAFFEQERVELPEGVFIRSFGKHGETFARNAVLSAALYFDLCAVKCREHYRKQKQ